MNNKKKDFPDKKKKADKMVSRNGMRITLPKEHWALIKAAKKEQGLSFSGVLREALNKLRG